jgi:hypothetical protein
VWNLPDNDLEKQADKEPRSPDRTEPARDVGRDVGRSDIIRGESASTNSCNRPENLGRKEGETDVESGQCL